MDDLPEDVRRVLVLHAKGKALEAEMIALRASGDVGKIAACEAALAALLREAAGEAVVISTTIANLDAGGRADTEAIDLLVVIAHTGASLRRELAAAVERHDLMAGIVTALPIGDFHRPLAEQVLQAAERAVGKCRAAVQRLSEMDSEARERARRHEEFRSKLAAAAAKPLEERARALAAVEKEWCGTRSPRASDHVWTAHARRSLTQRPVCGMRARRTPRARSRRCARRVARAPASDGSAPSSPPSDSRVGCPADTGLRPFLRLNRRPVFAQFNRISGARPLARAEGDAQ